METSPRFWPLASMSWTRGTRMSVFARGPSLVGAAALKGLRMVVVSLTVSFGCEFWNADVPMWEARSECQ
jgi:hypothetical protein